MSAGHHTEDGPEDTSAHPGGVEPSGWNGSQQLYRPEVGHRPVKAPPEVAAALAATRARLLRQAQARPR